VPLLDLPFKLDCFKEKKLSNYVGLIHILDDGWTLWLNEREYFKTYKLFQYRSNSTYLPLMQDFSSHISTYLPLMQEFSSDTFLLISL